MRGLAIAMVLYWHFFAPSLEWDTASFGGYLYRLGLLTWSGVDLFFVLSGFLIGGILIDARGARSFFAPFYLRRSFRILPLYLIFCVGGTVALTLNPGLRPIVGRPMPLYVVALFGQNVWLAHRPWDAFMSVTWSLAVEEQFYLTLPLIVRFVPRRPLPYVITTLAIASALGRSWGYLRYGPDWGVAALVLTPCRADALMIGVLGALIVRATHLRDFLASRSWPLYLAATVFGIGVAVLSWQEWTVNTVPMSTVGFTCLALFYQSLLLIAVLRTNSWWARAMRFRPLMNLGNIAYCVYLVHLTVFDVVAYLLRGYPRESAPDLLAAVVALVLTIEWARISWRAIESKMIGLGARLSRSTS